MSGARHRRPGLPLLIRAGLRLYPAAYRERFGLDLEADLERWIENARMEGLVRRALLMLRLASDVLVGAAAENLRRVRRGRGTRSGIGGDVVIACRTFLRRPLFTLAVVVPLGLGIGGVTAMWSVVDVLLVKPLPYRDADRLARVWINVPGSPYVATSPAQHVAWAQQARSIEAVASIAPTTGTIEGIEFATRVRSALVSETFFDVLGARLALGRSFREGDGDPGAAPIVILGYEMWKRDFGGSADVIGRTIRVNGVTREIVGVTASGFEWLEIPRYGPADYQLWLPRRMSPEERISVLQTVVRLRPGVDLDRARDELGGIVLAAAPKNWNSPASGASPVTVERLEDALYGPVRDRLFLPLAAIVLVLALACANVASLLLGRLPGRRADLALRAALGAGRRRIAAQLLIESLILSLAAAALGVAVAVVLTRVVATFGPVEVPSLRQAGVHREALLLVMLLAAACTATCGVLPAWRGSSLRAAHDLRIGRAGPAGSGAWVRAFLAVQIALALVLLSGAALMVRSFWKLVAIDTGYDSRNVILASVNMPANGYQASFGPVKQGGTAVQLLPAWEDFVRQTVNRLRTDPRVVAAAAATYMPLMGGGGTRIHREGHEPSTEAAPPSVYANYVTEARSSSATGIPSSWTRASTGPESRCGDGGPGPLPLVERES